MKNAVMRLFSAGSDFLGELNPQLLREIQGRLRLRNALLTVVCSLITQATFGFASFRRIHLAQGYCQFLDPKVEPGACWQFGNSYAFVNWHEWWFITFGWGCWFLLLFAVGAGSFLLISDLSKEKRRGTLTFLSLSPQSAQTILLGKMLGVPILVYFAIGLALPFHYYSGMMADVPLIGIVAYDCSMLIACIFFYSAALLLGFVGQWLNGFQSWLGSAGFLGLLQFSIVQSATHTSLDWYYIFFPSTLISHLKGFFSQRYSPFFVTTNMETLTFFSIPIGEQGVLLFFLMSVNLLLWTYWLWQVLIRRYQNPSASLLSKNQSYFTTICFTICHLGFGVSSSSVNEGTVFAYTLLLVIWFLLLIVLLTPQRQPFLDWARNSDLTLSKFWDSYLHGENSPIWISMLLNLLIAIGPVIIAILYTANRDVQIDSMSLVITALLLLIVTLLHQSLLFRSMTHRAWWMMVALFGPIVLPALLLAVLGFEPNQRGLELFLLTPLSILIKDSTSASVFGLACVFYMAVSLLMVLRLNRKIKRYGESEMARLMRGLA